MTAADDTDPSTVVQETSHQEMHEYYTEWWENPEDIRAPIFSRLNDIVHSRIPEGNGRRALDVGAGTGTITAFLLEKGYDVTAVEPNPEFAQDLVEQFPDVTVIDQPVQDVSFDQSFELVTMIEVLQNLSETDMRETIGKVGQLGRTLFTNVSNHNSVHGRWVEWRGFKKDFVYLHTAGDLERAIDQTGGEVQFERGVGLLTPLSLFDGFRGVFLPAAFAELVNRMFEHHLNTFCHLYYVEATFD